MHQPHTLVKSKRLQGALSILTGKMSLSNARAAAAAERIAMAYPPTGPNQLWQLGYRDFITERGHRLRVTGVADCWSRYEFPWRIARVWEPAAAEAALAMAILEAEALAREKLPSLLRKDAETGEHMTIKVVADCRDRVLGKEFVRYATSFDELDLIRSWRVSNLCLNDCERGFEALPLEPVPDTDTLREMAHRLRIEYNTAHYHPAIALDRPIAVHLGTAKHEFPNPPTM